MTESINVFNQITEKNDFFFYDRLEKELWEWKKCFNCSLCWDIKSETWKIEDAVVECLWVQSWINFIKLWDTCPNHNHKDNYFDILCKLKNWN